MKKIICLLFAVLFFVSCSSVKSVNSKSLASEKTEDEKQIKVIDGLLTQLVSSSPDVAWYRMAEEYRIAVSEADFCNRWNESIKSLGEFQTKTVSKISSSIHYSKYLAKLTFAQGDLNLIFVMSGNSIFPIDLIYTDSISEQKYYEYTKEDAESESLGELCAPFFRLGCGITGGSTHDTAVKVPKFMETVEKHFTSATYTNLMKPSYLLSQAGSIKSAKDGNGEPVLNFSACDPLLQWAKKHNKQIRGHTLVWHVQVPEWFFRVDYKSDGELASKDLMKFRMESYIRQYLTYVQTNYPGVVYCWDVVNEAVDPSRGDPDSYFACRRYDGDGVRKNWWYWTMGPEYVELAFTYARKYADPNVKLFYNDFSTVDLKKRECIFELCQNLVAKGLIDGIGMQGYWDVKNPSLKTIKDTIERFAETGLEIQLTEWSISAPTEDEAGFATQAERYASIFRLLQKLDTQGGGKANITCVSFFGVQDHYVLSKTDKTTSRLFDRNFDPKPVYYAIADTFKLYCN